MVGESLTYPADLHVSLISFLVGKSQRCGPELDMVQEKNSKASLEITCPVKMPSCGLSIIFRLCSRL